MQSNQPNHFASSGPASVNKSVSLATIPVEDMQDAPLIMQDYVNAFVVNEADEVLIVENQVNGRSWGSWRVVGRDLENGEDPIQAVQQNLRHQTGLVCEEWVYLGTFVLNHLQEQGAGHFFYAKNVVFISQPQVEYRQNTVKWISKRELKQALLDGRIAVVNHAVAICLAMVLCE